MTALDQETRVTPRLELRPFRRRDATAIHEAVLPSLPELARWLPWAQPGYTKGTTQRFVRDSINAWNEGKAFDFAIRFPAEPNKHIGNVSLWWTSRQNSIGEGGYWGRSDLTNRGICTEAVAAVLDIAFRELAMHKVVLRIAVGNRSSERVAEKLGFIMEGTLRDEVRIGDKWIDHTAWSLLRNEWRQERHRYVAEGLLAATR